VAGADSGVEINNVQPLVGLEFFEEREDVGNGEFAAAAVDELDGLSGLEVDAGDQHDVIRELWSMSRGPWGEEPRSAEAEVRR